jgi:hypothetical protein
MAVIEQSWKIGVCPICQRQGIGWCAGGIGDAHDTASIEVVEVVPASQLRGAVSLDELHELEVLLVNARAINADSARVNVSAALEKVRGLILRRLRGQ